MSAQETKSVLPLDWNEWRRMWLDWRECQRGRYRRSSHDFGPKNFMADEILAKWSIPGRGDVEISEGRFLSDRFIGVTWAHGCRPAITLHSFADLEAEVFGEAVPCED